MIALVLAVELIVLHLIDGRIAVINPKQVTRLGETRDDTSASKQLTKGIQCVIYFTDGHFASVVEPCAEVQKLMEGKTPDYTKE